MEYLFSYGTLKLESVQIENFGRILQGTQDSLNQYTVKKVEIKDEKVLSISKERFHPILFFTGNFQDEVQGIVFKVTAKELLEADKYETDDYKRVKRTLKSGIESWIYVSKK